jgi:hypothetical protein
MYKFRRKIQETEMKLQIILNIMDGRYTSGKSADLKPKTSLVKHTASFSYYKEHFKITPF